MGKNLKTWSLCTQSDLEQERRMDSEEKLVETYHKRLASVIAEKHTLLTFQIVICEKQESPTIMFFPCYKYTLQCVDLSHKIPQNTLNSTDHIIKCGKSERLRQSLLQGTVT